MARQPTPWFKLYAQEFLCDEKVKFLSLEERGALVTLWAHMWCNGIKRGCLFLTKKTPLPDEEIAHILKLSLDNFLKIKVKFTKELSILKIGKFGELYSKRLRKYRTPWELYGGQKETKQKPKRIQKEKKPKTEVEVELESELEVEKDYKHLVDKLKSLILQNNPKAKITANQIKNWGEDVRLMIERDNRTIEEISEIIEWSQNHKFWKTNVLSMGKLREKFDQLTMQKKRGQSTNPSWMDKYNGKK